MVAVGSAFNVQRGPLRMSIFSSLNTAVSGLNAQSHAFSDLSNNIANSQTTGYKAVGTSFSDYVTHNELASGGGANSDSVKATTDQQNAAQGTIAASSNSLALAISGNGFFNVVQSTGNSASGVGALDTSQQYYTRNGNFSLNAQGYLVNSSGYALEGKMVGANGQLNSATAPIQVNQNMAFQPTQSTQMNLVAAIGTTGSTGATNTSTATAYDAKGNASQVTLDWTQSASNPLDWTVANAADPGNTTAVTFGSDGSLASVGSQTTAGANGTFQFQGSPQNMSVDLGTIGTTGGVSLSSSASTVVTNPTMSTDSVTSGSFNGVAIKSDGSVMATFTNGLSQLVGKVQLTTFQNVNGLTSQDGQAYTASADAGQAKTDYVGSGGMGTLDVGALEGSTTDLTGDLTQLIAAQQAYGANTKVVSTADQIMQTTIAMIQ